MMRDIRAFVQDVEAAVGGSDATRRREMLRSVTQLFVGQAAQLNEEHVAAFDTVIIRLARDIEMSARTELSEQLADLSNAPRGIIRDLAFDVSAQVAGPVLERSTQLSEEDLVQVAGQGGQGHLVALTRRRSLSERLTDVILERGNSDVARSVGKNDGARFSEQGHHILAVKASADPILLSALQQRTDIPPAYRRRLVELAEQRARKTFASDAGEVTVEAIGRAAAIMKAPVRDDLFLTAEVTVSERARKQDLNEFDIATWLQAGQETEALIALARLAGVSSQIALQAYEAETDEPLLVLVRASKCGWRILKLLITAKTGTQPPPLVMQGMMDAFLALSPVTAQRVVRFSASHV